MATEEKRKTTEIITRSATETIELGRKIGKTLTANDLLALVGPLGAGKTTLVQGLAQGLGVNDYVTSPTFIIINEHQGRIPLYHIDLYRLENPAAIFDLGIEEYFTKGGVCVIEWAERLGNLRPASAFEVELQVLSVSERKICVSSDLVAQLKLSA